MKTSYKGDKHMNFMERAKELVSKMTIEEKWRR